jgi:hypothetical protein
MCLTVQACMGGARRDARVHYARAALNDARFMRPAQVLLSLTAQNLRVFDP